MWKILMEQIKEEMYYLQINHGLFPEEQIECHKGTRGTGNLLYIGQHILKESKTRPKNVAMAWIDYKKVYDIVSWVIDCLKLYKISSEVKVYRENHEKLESGIDCKMKNLNWGENSERYLPGRCTITITICDSDDATESHRKCTNLMNRKRCTWTTSNCLPKMKKHCKPYNRLWRYTVKVLE